jgi:hypothetical protein
VRRREQQQFYEEIAVSNILRNIAAGLAMACAGAAAWSQINIDFSSANGTGTAQDKVLIQNVRVTSPVANPFDPNTNTTAESTYNVLFTFDPATLHLVPQGITQASGTGANTCATVNVQVYNSVLGVSGPLSGATVLIGTRSATTNSSGVATFSNVPPGLTAFTAYASGYVATSQVAALDCTATPNAVAMALSPSSGSGSLSSGQFRVILNWGANPSDLDSHMTGPNADSSRWHVYYSSRTSGGICNLDVDDTSSYGPETVTCPSTTSTTGLRNGVYRYSVHHYAGSGTIGSSGATVRLEFGNGTVYNYTPPVGFTTSKDVWTVFELTVNNGSISVAPVNAVTHGISASSVTRPKQLTYGAPENGELFQNLSK